MKKTIAAFSLLSLLPFFVFGQAKKNSGPLDGRKYVVVMVQDEKKEISDEINFSSGKCKTTFFGKDWAFPAKPYDVTFIDSSNVDKKNFQFMWESTNDANEKIALQGSIDGDAIEGTAEITNKKGKTLKTYTFTGTQKKKKVPGAK